MREICFRGYSPTMKTWLYGDLSQGYFDHDVQIACRADNSRFRVVPESVGQYTGLKDARNREIYEGDIVEEHNTDGELKRVGPVIWKNLFAAWHISPIGAMYGDKVVSYKIIGNVYENPELLDGGSANGI